MNENRTSLDIYINELRDFNCSALDLEKELELLKEASEGSRSAKEKIIKANLRFVITVAKKYAKNSDMLEDLIQAGNIALYESFDTFDYTKFIRSGCNRFITYAGRRIAQKIELESKKFYSVSITDGKFKEMKKLNSEMTKIGNEDGELTDEKKIEIAAQRLGMKKKAAMTLVNSSKIASSMEYQSEDDEKPFSERLADNSYATPEDDAIMNVSAIALRKSLEKLDRIEEEVITLAYGLDGSEPLNYPAIGIKLGYTREGVRLVHNRAIEHLREEMGIAA